jgi:hypothetical protein
VYFNFNPSSLTEVVLNYVCEVPTVYRTLSNMTEVSFGIPVPLGKWLDSSLN